MKIARISLRYDRDEDRLALAVADAQGGTELLWLTRRLADRLVAALVQALDADVELGRLRRSKSASPQPDKAVARRAAEHGWAQLAARMALKASDPVAVAVDGAGRLLVRARLARRPRGYRLEMDAGTGGLFTLAMRQEEVRQWLQLLRNAYAKAGWSSDVWPDWLPILAPVPAGGRT